MEGFQLERHYKLWEENNKLLKRATFVIMVVSIALIVKVISPFVADSISKKPILDTIKQLNDKKNKSSQEEQVIEKTGSILQDIEQFIAAQPWQKEKTDLIKRYRQMKAASSLERRSSADYQSEANATIYKIGEMLRDRILEPLRRNMNAHSQEQNLTNLNNEVTKLDNFIQDWEQNHIETNWYQTLNLKNATMLDLTQSLNQRLNEFSTVIEHELQIINQARKEVNEQLQKLNGSIAAEKDKLQDIEKELQTILPEWLRGLVTTEQVIQLLPVFLLGSAIYVFIAGLGLTRHYQIYAAGKEFKQGVTTDPSMSSIWTLIARGRYGTVFTMGIYVLFFVLVWVMLEKSVDLLLNWMVIDTSKAWIRSQKPWGLYLWCSRLTFIALIAYVTIKPWWSMARPPQSARPRTTLSNTDLSGRDRTEADLRPATN